MALKVERSAGREVPVVSVCMGKKGPYPFVVATGTGQSVVVPALAHKLHLRRRGPGIQVRGVTCQVTSRLAKVKTWSMGGVRLEPQDVLVARVAAQGLKPAPKGVIGSDVLARFDAVRIDYHTAKLTLLVSEVGPARRNVLILGQKTTKPPSVLMKGKPKVSAPLRVLVNPDGTIVAVSAKIGKHLRQLAVDSGSASSAVAPNLSSALKLKATGKKSAVAGVGCKGTSRVVGGETLALAGTRLRDAAFVSRRIAGTVNSGLEGVLGSDALSTYGAAVIDYRAAHLWLGAG